jgi:hypothetical protein
MYQPISSAGSSFNSEKEFQRGLQRESFDVHQKEEKRPRILLCDSECSYGERLMEYLQNCMPFPLEIELYTSRESLLEKSEPENVSLMIVSEREYCKGAMNICGKCELLVLNESEKYLKDVNNVSKYQSMDSIMEVIRELVFRDEETVPGMIRHGHPMHLVGFYSPISRCLQTTAALTFGEFLARQHRTLYMNYEAYSGMEQLLGQRFRSSAADLLYYNECARDKLAAQLGLATFRLGKLDYIPPMKSFAELQAAEAEKWLSLFHSMEHLTEYEFIVLDLSEAVNGLFDILRACERIITITREDLISTAKIRAYEQLLQKTGYTDLAAKTRWWQFKMFKEIPAAMDNLTHGEMADCVRKWMEKDGYYADESEGASEN